MLMALASALDAGPDVCEADKVDSSSERSELQRNFPANAMLTFCTGGMLIFSQPSSANVLLARCFVFCLFNIKIRVASELKRKQTVKYGM